LKDSFNQKVDYDYLQSVVNKISKEVDVQIEAAIIESDFA